MHARRSYTTKPRLEALEDRWLPAQIVYTWVGAAGGNWDVPANWNPSVRNGATYPKTDEDTAILDGVTKNTDVTLNLDVTIGKFEAKNGFTSLLKLEKSLTIEKGQNPPGDSLIASAATLAPQSADGSLLLKGVRLEVQQGSLGNETTTKTSVNVINGATLDFNLKSGVKLAMDVLVGSANGGATAGTIKLGDADAGFQGRNVTVYQDAKFTVNKDSVVDLLGKDGDAWLLDDGVTSAEIYLAGELNRTGSGEVRIELPVGVIETGKLSVTPDGDSTKLTIRSNGTAQTQNQSLWVANGGTVQLNGKTGTATGFVSATLSVLKDIWFLNGKLFVKGDTVLIEAANVQFSGNGNNALLDLRGNAYTTLRFQLTGAEGKVWLEKGKWGFDVEGGGTNRDRVLVNGGLSTGNLTIEESNTELLLATIGNGQADEEYDIIEAQFSTIVGDFATHPNTFDTSKYATPGGVIYRVKRL